MNIQLHNPPPELTLWQKLKACKALVSGDVLPLKLSEWGKLWDQGLIDDPATGRLQRPTKPYNQVEWVWICINIIISICQSIQMMLSTADDKIVEEGELYDFLFNKNNKTKITFSSFVSRTIGFYTLEKEVYWIFLEKDGLVPTDIRICGKQQCMPIVAGPEIIGYQFMLPGGKVFPLFVEDVWPIMNFQPDLGHWFRGASPLDAGQAAIASNYQASLFNEATLAHGARMSVILTTPPGVKLDEQQIASLRSQFEYEHAGARKAGKAFIATGGIGVEEFSQSMVDLQMIDLRKFDATTICALFGVPPELVGLNPEAQYAHGPATQRMIIYTIAPMLAIIAENITNGIASLFQYRKNKAFEIKESKIYCGTSVTSLKRKKSYRQQKALALNSGNKLISWFDWESHPAIQEMMLDKTEKVMLFVEKGVPLKQVIDTFDLPFDAAQIPWADEYFISPSLVPARWIIEGGPEGYLGSGPSLPEGGNEPEPEPENEPSQTEDQQKAVKDEEIRRLRIWHSWIISWVGIEKEYTQALRLLFVRQQRILTDKLKAAFGQFKKSAQKDAADDEIIARVVFSLEEENGKIRAINQTFFEKASELGLRQIAAEAAITGAALAQFIETGKRATAIKRALFLQAEKIQGINVTTQKRIANQLREGLSAGEGLPDLTNRINDCLGGNRKRAQSIARTQVGGAISSGRYEGIKELGLYKIWLDSHDEHVRATHKDAAKRYARGIPATEPFAVGGDFLMYPGDPHGSAKEIINCRCVPLAVKPGESKEMFLAKYMSYKFVFYEEVKGLLKWN